MMTTKAKYNIIICNNGVIIKKRFLWFFYDRGISKKFSEMNDRELSLLGKIVGNFEIENVNYGVD